MTAPLSGTTTPFQWSIQSVPAGRLTVPSARLEVELFLRTTLPGLRVIAELGWLDTGAPLSIIPFHVHNRRLDWSAVPGVTVSWAGQTCDLGSIDIWLPTDQSSSPRGPFSLLAKFPRSDPPGGPIPALLGLEFFVSHQAGISLLPPPQRGVIQVP
ncbi:MAG TPA: hypothetical protein VMV69_02585 [Pirellulales bacterium]|nr:hypothetical protein [Pirellulales bacterium]